MTRTMTLADGSAWTYRYSIRGFIAFEAATGRSYTGQTLTDSVVMMGCTLYDHQQANPTLEQIMETIDQQPERLREWIQWFTEDAKAWSKAYEGDTHEAQDDKKKESATESSIADS